MPQWQGSILAVSVHFSHQWHPLFYFILFFHDGMVNECLSLELATHVLQWDCLTLQNEDLPLPGEKMKNTAAQGLPSMAGRMSIVEQEDAETCKEDSNLSLE
jgi:hypothetical protein